MTRGERDERLGITEVSRRGAHRPRTNPVLGLLPMLGLGALVIGVGLLAYLLFGRDGEATTAAVPSVTAPSAGQSAGPLPSASGSPSGAGQASQPIPSASVEASPSPSAEPSASSSPQASVDRTLTVNFYNGSSPKVPGLSRQAASKVEAGGWKIGAIADWTGGAVDRTTIYYADPAQMPTVRAVIGQLGLGAAKLNTNYAKADALAVVISNDYSR